MTVTLGSITEIVNAQLSQNQFNSVDSIALMARKLVERHQEDRADVAINFERADLIRATKKIAEMVGFKQKIADTVIATAKAAEAINWVKSYLSSAKTELNKILGSTSNEDRAAAAASVNNFIRDINSKVNGANQMAGFTNLNLVGNTKGPNWKTDDIFTPTSDTGPGFVQIEGTFLGVDFQVTDTNGLNWRLNSADNTFYQYKSDGTGLRTGQSLSAEGLTIDSYDPSTGAITYGGTGSLSGTLTRAGLNLLTSEYYNNFAEDTSVQTAINDIDNALTFTTQKGSSILADAALFEGKIKIINSKIQNLEDEKLRIKDEELAASSAKTMAADLKIRLALNNINMLSQASNGLLENMLTLSAGPPKALGVFGLLGY